MRIDMQRTVLLLASAMIVALLLIAAPAAAADGPAAAERERAAEILEGAGVQGGLVVHLGCGDGRLTAALRAGDGYLVQGLDADAGKVSAARRHIRELGAYGPVSVDHLAGKRLPYVDNLVNLIVVEEPSGVADDELMRVLAPRGVAYVKQDGGWTKTVKPVPADIDEWSHYMHDAGGNAVAHDDVVGPPRHLQWIGSPRWSRHHDRMASMSALVSSGGRMFYIMDEGSRVSIQLPARWSLIARDAFNGTILWKQPIAKWHSHLWPLKSGPTQLARRLVGTPDVVYATLGVAAPLTALDAATGKVLRTYDQTASTEELIHADGTLFLLVNRGESELARYVPANNVGDQQRVGKEFLWDGKPRELMAVDAESGRQLWKVETPVSPLTLTADGARVVFHDGGKVVALDRKSGSQLWTSPSAPRRPGIPFHFGPRLVLHEGVVLFAGGERTMRAFDATSGKLLWTAPHARSSYQSPEDVLVAGGLVWNAPTTSTKDSGVFTGRDLRTGEVKQEFAPNVETYWFHHRCHMAKATDRFLLPSRTGIEFVDPQKKDWDIHHWVRGGCLYGIMPCNGLVYAPPHNCACYPEAKLYGLNALAPAAPSREVPREVPEAGRLEKGPAFGQVEASELRLTADDWPTYRHDTARSGFTKTTVPTDLAPGWTTELGGRLSSPVVAGGMLLVAQIDAHTVHALSAETGEKLWSYTTGGRVDSPPSVEGGRVLFGSADGWVYCLRAKSGELIWRYRAAPEDRRLSAFEQLESVWPVHGTVLVAAGEAWVIAGRSNYLDGGLRLLRLNAGTGEKIDEKILDDLDPQTGRDLQERLQILNMPVGLSDVLSYDGRHVYMRSQRFDMEGNRQDLGPHSGDPRGQASVQAGVGAHLFSPNGFLDGSYFHRSYWVYGRSFAGGHGGYFQAGKFAPSGRLLVFDDKSVYGFARKPQYLRWTTPLEHQLFAADKTPPEVKPTAGPSRQGLSMVHVEKSPSLDPTGKPLTVEAWVMAERPEGVVLAHGGPAQGYALAIRKGQPRFLVRADDELSAVVAKKKIVGRWVHLAGVLQADKRMQLYVDGELVASGKASGLIGKDPAQDLQIGADDQTAVGDYKSPATLTGLVDEVRVYQAPLTAEQIAARAAGKAGGEKLPPPVLACSFDKRDAADGSGHENHGKVLGAEAVKGKIGAAMRFTARARSNRSGGSLVKHHWDEDIPLLVRAMVGTEAALFVAGPPDLIDEEKSFQRIMDRDATVDTPLARQAAALDGAEGGILWVVSPTDGKKLAELKLDGLPVWDGLIAAGRRLYMATEDGRVVSYGGR